MICRWLSKNHIYVVIILCSIFSQYPFSSWADLKVSNREPVLGEFGYRPVEGSTIKRTPPGFVWLPEKQADTYILQCSQQESFSSIGYEMSRIRGNVHCPPGILKPGKWYWRYTFLTNEGDKAAWSKVRSFTVSPDAVYFPQPAIEDLRKRLPQKHPKLFLRPETIPSFRNNLQQNFSTVWIQYLEHMEEMLRHPVVTTEPKPYPDGKRGLGKSNIDLWRHNRRIVTDAVDHAANLAFAYLLTGNQRYGSRAKEWLLAVVSWPANGTTSYRYNDECAMSILSSIPRAYTWIYDFLSKEERMKVIHTMTLRGREVYQYLQDHHHTVTPYASHRNRAWHFLGETAIAFIDDIPEAQTWLQYAMDIFYCVYPVWSDDEGGWHEGAPYWFNYINRITWWLDILRTAFRIDGYRMPYFSRSGDFPLYVVPPRAEFGGFGDSADFKTASDMAPLMDVLAERTGNPYWKWYAGQTGYQKISAKPTFLDLLRLHLSSIRSQPPTDIPQSKVFHGTGIASLHSRLSDTDDDVHILFKSSPFGSQSHGFNAQNSFLLWAYGHPLLIWSGHRDWHGSRHHKEWMWETFSDNCITVNGQGQRKHSPLAKGNITAEYLSPELDYVAGDATQAYEGRLNRFVRHIFFVKPRIVILLDELEAQKPSTFTFHLHSYGQFSTKNPYEIETSYKTAAARIVMVTPDKPVITQSSKMDPPSMGFDKTQWHLNASTPEKVTQTTFLTLIRPYPAGKFLQGGYHISQINRNQDVYLCYVGSYRLLLIHNPKLEPYTYSGIHTNARFVIMKIFKEDQEGSIFFAIENNFVKIGETTLFQADHRDTYLVHWKDIKDLLEKNTTDS